MLVNRMEALILAAAIASANVPAALASDQQRSQVGPDGGSYAAASVSNIVYVPSKAIACAFSGVLWFGTMVLTGGTKYRMAGEFVDDVCTGNWVIRGEDVAKKKDFFFED